MSSGFRCAGNLHPELTSFVGRTRLLANLKRHLAESRLVTVTGIGGVGKSRTVLRLAHQVRSQYPDGVWFADLARLQDAGMVKHTIASALGIADQSSRAESESLSEWVGERDMLLIIDTCEHLVQGCAELVHELLEAAPNLKVLATSRQSLHLPYEQVVPVPPLLVPGDDPAENLIANESVQLFALRAGVVVPGFELDDYNIIAVAELCRRLDGVPLAIELAAVRLRMLSVEQILGLLADRFSLLAGASRTNLPRHQTLRAAIGWSYELCEPAERLLWARLSVFAGDFELDAAQYGCSDQRLPLEDIPELVMALVEKSVLLITSNRLGVRYKLIDTLAEYGEEWLDKLGESQQMRQRHLEYYLRLAQRSEDAWSGPRQIYWMFRMRQEHDNVRVALEHALSSPTRSSSALVLLSSLWFMWVCCGFVREGRLYLERALEANPSPSKERCKALWVLSYVRSSQGDGAESLRAAVQCSLEALRVGDSRAVILASKMQGTAALLQGDLQRANALLAATIEFNTDNKELTPGLLPAIVELSLLLSAQGKLYEAESLLQDCLQVCRERGELWVSSYAQWAMSRIRLATGRADEGLHSAREALRIKWHFHDTLGTLLVLETIARILIALKNAPTAAKLLGALQQNWRSAGLPQLGAPFLTDDHDACVDDCMSMMGELAYKNAFEDGARLDLDEASMLALGDLSMPTVLEVRVPESDSDGLATVEKAVVRVVDAFGLAAPAEDGSRNDCHTIKLRADAPGVSVNEQFEEMDRALREESPGVDVDQTSAVDALFAALEDVDRAVVLVDQTLLVKVNGKVDSRRLSMAEQTYLDNYRHLFNDPAMLLRELDQLGAKAAGGPSCRVEGVHRETIIEHLGATALVALESWAATGNYEILTNVPLWVKRGYTEGRLLGLVIKTPRGSDERTMKVVAKLCPPGTLSREPEQHRHAWDGSPRSFRKDHLVRLRSNSPRLSDAGGYVLLQEVAGGSFVDMCQMEEVTSHGEIIAAFHAVMKGLLCSWNRRRPDPYSHVDSGKYLQGELRRVLSPDGKLRAWALENNLLHPERRWVVFEGERTASLLPNPLAMAMGDIVGTQNVQHLRGLTHGDLHTGNILLPRTREGELLPDRFRLVDLTTFEESAPLTRDPAMLLLSIVAKRIPVDSRAEEELFEQIVRGVGRDDLFAPLMSILHDACGQLIPDDFRDDWRNQLPLSLLSAALLHCTFGNLDEYARWWFFRLAARCGAEYLLSTDSWRPPGGNPYSLGPESMAGFRMSSR